MGKIWGIYGEYMGKCEPEVRRWIFFWTSEFWWKSSTTLPRRNVPTQARLTGDSNYHHGDRMLRGVPRLCQIGRFACMCVYLQYVLNIPDPKKGLMGWNLPFQNLIWCCTLKAVHGIYPFFSRAYIPVTVDTQFHQLNGYLKYPKIIG